MRDAAIHDLARRAGIAVDWRDYPIDRIAYRSKRSGTFSPL